MVPGTVRYHAHLRIFCWVESMTPLSALHGCFAVGPRGRLHQGSDGEIRSELGMILLISRALMLTGGAELRFRSPTPIGVSASLSAVSITALT